jgi:hypothetical protein
MIYEEAGERRQRQGKRPLPTNELIKERVILTQIYDTIKHRDTKQLP